MPRVGLSTLVGLVEGNRATSIIRILTAGLVECNNMIDCFSFVLGMVLAVASSFHTPGTSLMPFTLAAF